MESRQTQFRTAQVSEQLAAELYAKIPARDFGLSLTQFQAALERAAAKHARAQASPGEVADFCRGLRLEELSLTTACAEGISQAWDIFIVRYRPGLYAAARAIAKEESKARELADSIYAELYGMRAKEGGRVSKLVFYNGRGSLEGWLRTVVAQEFVNQYRKSSRLISLEEKTEAGMQFAAPAPSPVDSSLESFKERLVAATDAALKELPPDEKVILSSYFLDQRTLAEIGRILGMHESTVSRRLEKSSKHLRKRIIGHLRRMGMSQRQAEEALEVDVRDLGVSVRANLEKNAPATQGSVQGRAEDPFQVVEEKPS